MRETLFNWLAPYIDGAQCLDLFAGTGALCLEALSRGASAVVMVERSSDALRQLRANVQALGAAGAETVGLDALEYLRGRPRAFDVVFLDPPFAVAAEMIRECGERLGMGWVRPGGVVYIEAPRFAEAPALPDAWTTLKRGSAGQVDYRLMRVPTLPR